MPDGDVLVIGASGFIGGRVADVFSERWPGGARRGYSRTVPSGGVHCDHADIRSLRAAMRDVDIVINCARSPWGLAEGREAARNLAGAAASSGVKRLIHMSSVAVYGSLTGVIDESQAPGPGLSAYGIEKVETERILEQSAAPQLRVVALRLALVYGRGGPEWSDRFIAAGRARRLQHLGPMGEGDANLVHVDDVAAFCLSLAEADLPVFSAANVVGDDVPSFNEYFALLARAMGMAPLPQRRERRGQWERRRILLKALSRFGGRIPGRWSPSLIQHGSRLAAYDEYATRVRFSTARARELGFRPEITVEQGVALSLTGARAGKAA